jgi:hypothetical protein
MIREKGESSTFSRLLMDAARLLIRVHVISGVLEIN